MAVSPLEDNRSEARNWTTATRRDLKVTLGEFSNFEVGDFTGRGEYFVVELKESGKKFIKTILRKDFLDDSSRRAEGELLASMAEIPSTSRIAPLTPTQVLQSTQFSGDFYAVSTFKEHTRNLYADRKLLDPGLLMDLGEFTYRLGSTAVPRNFETRRASDSILSLLHLSESRASAEWSQSSRGAHQAISIVQSESPKIKALIEELNSFPDPPVFSHGDLKLAQFIEPLGEDKILLCDWEECGVSSHLADLCFLCSDVFYSQVRSQTDDDMAGESDPALIQESYDSAVANASTQVSRVLTGYLNARRKPFSDGERRAIEIRIGLSGLYRLFTVGVKGSDLRPRELALASIGMQIALGDIPELF
ncbi:MULTISPECIES: phosphotransferase family protein [Corynebacterium]|uniref:Phosphotransferase enzyme family protein n=1 Tax=Corynebacterium timonense TaxID=441500 RepID=A0A1H1UDX0_9CORY|nr:MULTISPECIES: hypothetical protein [Corynebacterium]WJY69152.1 hypothetical protein CAURIS_11430 [Corynebacterium auris]SDS70653.1 hypothetical protein SAMN04488539_2218 [Corynebacterium timonense]